MLSYPLEPEQLKEAKSIEISLKFLFNKIEKYTDTDLIIARNLTEKYKKIMDWDTQELSGPLYPTT